MALPPPRNTRRPPRSNRAIPGDPQPRSSASASFRARISTLTLIRTPTETVYCNGELTEAMPTHDGRAICLTCGETIPIVYTTEAPV